MKKNNKIKIISASLALMAISGQANAQWAVTDLPVLAQQKIISASNMIMQQLEQYYKPRQDAQASATVKNTSAINESIAASTQQSISNVQSMDARFRKALGESEEAKILLNSLPSIDQCAEATKGMAGGTKSNTIASTSRNMRSGGGGGTSYNKYVTTVTSTATAQGAILNDKKTLQTCSPEIAGAAGCVAGETQKYAKGDYQPRGIKGNIESTEGTAIEFNNLTYTKEGLGVAQKYANTSALFDKPKYVKDPDLMAKNPGYAALYIGMMSKLEAAHDAISDIQKMRVESEKPTAAAADMWSKVTDYEKITGLKKKPTNPSMMDLINYQASNDFLGNPNAKLSTIDETNNRLALQNYLLLNQYKQQENTNILLSHILVQLTTPVTKAQVDAEFNKTVSMGLK